MTDKAQNTSNKDSQPAKAKPQPTPQPFDQMAEQALPQQQLIQRAKLDPGRLSPREVQQLQRMVGNRAVGKILARTAKPPAVQPKLDHGLTHTTLQGAPPIVQRKPVLETIDNPSAGLKILLNGIDSDSGDDEKLRQLVSNFNNITFTYTMRAKADFTPIIETGAGDGDCNTLANAMKHVAETHLGIAGVTVRSADFIYVDSAEKTIDQGYIPNVEGGAGWVFDNHYWVKGPGGEYDPLFGREHSEAGWHKREKVERIANTTLDRETYEGGQVLFGPIIKGERYEYGKGEPPADTMKLDSLNRAATLNAEVIDRAQTLEPGEKPLFDFGASKKDKKGLCYITTACVEAQGLPDDCEELTVLRRFREEYLRKLKHGDYLISLYYKHSPTIVTAINRHKKREKIYEELYEVIQLCVEAIKQKQNEVALKIYIEMVLKLQHQYTAEIELPDERLKAALAQM